jgi:hypothetical protein
MMVGVCYIGCWKLKIAEKFKCLAPFKYKQRVRVYCIPSIDVSLALLIQ